jgi:hypothetical protein
MINAARTDESALDVVLYCMWDRFPHFIELICVRYRSDMLIMAGSHSQMRTMVIFSCRYL